MTQNQTPDQDRYERARQRVELLRGFYGHAVVYVIVNLGLIAWNLATTPGDLWFVPTLLGWGIGLAAHAAYALSAGRFLGPAWTERKIREELDRTSR
jgi:hypothetical protein